MASPTGLKRDYGKGESENKKMFSDELNSKSKETDSIDSRNSKRNSDLEKKWSDKSLSAKDTKDKNESVTNKQDEKKSGLSSEKSSDRRSEKENEKLVKEGSGKDKVKDKTKTADKNAPSAEELVAISNFMASVESELEIPPTRVLEAMAESSNASVNKQAALATSQDLSVMMDQVATQLNLDPEQTKNLAKISEKSLASHFNKPMELQTKLSLISDKLGDDFHVQVLENDQGKQLEDKLLAAGLLLSSESADDSVHLMDKRVVADAKQSLGRGKSFFASETQNLNQIQGLSPLQIGEPQMLNSIHQMNERFWMKPDPSSSGYQNQIMQVLNQEQGFQPQAIGPTISSTDDGSGSEYSLGLDGQPNILNTSLNQPVNGEINFFNRSLMNDVKKSEMLDEKFKSIQQALQELGAGGGLLFASKDGRPIGLNEMKLGQSFSQPLTDNQKAENLQKLLGESSYLVKNGGGEMKVKLHPEGLGAVDLKVMMQDGRVQLEMVTDSKEAKNLLDSQIADLKLGLAAQKLSIDHIKIDHVNSANTDQSTQFFSNLNSQDQSRQDLRQMWAQMNDFGSQARKGSYMEMMNPKGVNPGREALRTAPEAAASKSVQRYDGRGREVNLVA